MSARPRQVALGLAVSAAVLAAAALLFFGSEHSRSVELPVPTGLLPVGRTRITSGDISLWVWYPAATIALPGPYVPDETRKEWERARPRFINALTADLSKVRPHSAPDVAAATAGAPYPIVMFGGGGSGASGLSFSTLAEDLASHGYVVASPDSAGGTNPELCVGRADEDACALQAMTPRLERIGRALDELLNRTTSDPRFANRFDLTRVGIAGHSFGGAQAAQFCAQDSRCKAGIDIDGRLFDGVASSGIGVPFMFLLSDHGTIDDPLDRRIMDQIQSVYDRQPRDSRVRAVISGSHHFTFSDDGALLKSVLFRTILRAFGRLRIDGRRQLEVTAFAVRTFFDAYLKGGPDGRSALSSPAFPELLLSR